MEYRCFLVKYYERETGGMRRWVQHVAICYSFTAAMGLACRIVESDYQRLDTIEACY